MVSDKSPPDPRDETTPDEVEEAAVRLDFAEDQRKWLAAINRTVATLFTDEQLPEPVKTSYYRFLRAAFDRMARICRSDIVESE